jgi:hypothetical protein
MDKNLDDITVCFLNVADTTGGNSGSPVPGICWKKWEQLSDIGGY